MNPAAEWQALFGLFFFHFTRPSLALFRELATGWVLCLGRRTVTRIIPLADPDGERAHDAYHRFLRAGRWSTSNIWGRLSRLLVNRFAATGRIGLDLDDTLFHKSGKKVNGAGWWRDAVRSTGQKTITAFGLNLVLLTVRVTPPWGGMPLALPVNMRLHRKGEASLLELAKQMIVEFAAWFPERELDLAADGFYAPLAGALPAKVYFTSRMRRDAALYAPPPPRKKGQRGPSRKKGKRLPTPEQMARDPKGWRLVETSERGKSRKRLVKVVDMLWYKVSPKAMVRLVISRDPDGRERDDFFFTTDLQAAAETVIGNYAGRWAIEETFKNTKQHLGGEHPQSWKGQGPERVAALSFWLYSAVWYWYLVFCGDQISWLPRPWYPKKCAPSFIDALAFLRRCLWREKIIKACGGSSVNGIISGKVDVKIAEELVEALSNAA